MSRKCECGEVNHDASKYKEALAEFLKLLFSDESYKREYGVDVDFISLDPEDAADLRSGDFTIKELSFDDSFGPRFFCRVGKADISVRGEAAKKVLELWR